MPTAPKSLHVSPAATSEKRRQNSYRRGYKPGWADAFKAAHPLCECCEEFGIVEATFCCDHIIPHRGNKALFDDQGNWQSLCEKVHQLKTYWENRGVIIFVSPRVRGALDVLAAGYQYRPELVSYDSLVKLLQSD